MKYLTKSNFTDGLKCPKLLWLKKNKKEIFPDTPSLADEFTMKQGVYVGDLATKLYDGIYLKRIFFDNVKETKENISKREILFEAGFMYDRCYARVDILVPVGTDSWDIIEVKSGTKIKPENKNIEDVAFQYFVLQKNGLRINKCYLMYLDKSYFKEGELNLNKLFKKEDITDRVLNLQNETVCKIKEFLHLIDDGEPSSVFDKKCLKCSGISYCGLILPKHNVLQLNNFRKTKDLVSKGYMDLEKIPLNLPELKDKYKIHVKSVQEDKVYINKPAIKEFLKTLKYPLYFLDFETFNSAVPVYDKTNTYYQLPFQYSLHIQRKEGDALEHYEFLGDMSKDPRDEFLKSLKSNLGTHGSIIVYNKSFESRILRESAVYNPEYKKWALDVIDRIVDLEDPFKRFDIYSPKQKGRSSIKCVLPAFTDLSYSGLEINNGDKARIMYYYASFGDFEGNKIPKEELDSLRSNLLKYCELDTYAMVRILEELKKMV